MTYNDPIFNVKKEPYGKKQSSHFVCPICNSFLDEPTVRYKTPQCPFCNTRLKWPQKNKQKINTNYSLSDKTIKVISVSAIITGIILISILFLYNFLTNFL